MGLRHNLTIKTLSLVVKYSVFSFFTNNPKLREAKLNLLVDTDLKLRVKNARLKISFGICIHGIELLW